MKNIYFLLIALVISISACTGSSISLEGEWTLVSYGNASNPTSALPNVETSIKFDANNQIGGTVGCNSFGGEYKLNSNQVTFSGIFSTLMFCEGTMDQETVFLNILSEQTLNFELNGSQLTLTTQDGSSAIVLERK